MPPPLPVRPRRLSLAPRAPSPPLPSPADRPCPPRPCGRLVGPPCLPMCAGKAGVLVAASLSGRRRRSHRVSSRLASCPRASAAPALPPAHRRVCCAGCGRCEWASIISTVAGACRPFPPHARAAAAPAAFHPMCARACLAGSTALPATALHVTAQRVGVPPPAPPPLPVAAVDRRRRWTPPPMDAAAVGRRRRCWTPPPLLDAAAPEPAHRATALYWSTEEDSLSSFPVIITLRGWPHSMGARGRSRSFPRRVLSTGLNALASMLLLLRRERCSRPSIPAATSHGDRYGSA